MFPSYLSPALNHLWQSTLVAAVAAALVLALRRNHAKTRYTIWLVASLKFLFPFSLLIAIGSRFEWHTAAALLPHSAPAQVMEEVFVPAVTSAAPVSTQAASNPVPIALLMIWAIGFAAVLISWWLRWRRVRALMRTAKPLSVAGDVPVLVSSALMEPGVFGIVRPVLLLPEGISEHLEPAHLEAILAHELCHIRRRDNLAAALHMLVEAIFWFHPLVWWIGARLVEERERACDEEVLRLGNKPQVYAESILKTCQYYLESPIACMSGVTGADLKKRIVHIMTHRSANKLVFGKKLTLAIVALATITGPVAIGLMRAQDQAQPQTSNAKRPEFEAASVKPAKSGAQGQFIRNQPGGRFTATNMPLRALIGFAYNLQPFQLSGGPSWLDERFDVEATPGSATGEGASKPREDSEKQMDEQRERLQVLLEDRFKLTFHRDTKELPVYALVVAKNGPKLKETAVANGGNRLPGMMMGRDELRGQAVPIKFLADTLSRQVGRMVLDKTGLTGKYDFTLKFTPDSTQGPGGPFGGGPGPGPGGPTGRDMPPPPDPNGPSIFTAIQEQLGLKLESQKGPVETLVIDNVEQPSEN